MLRLMQQNGEKPSRPAGSRELKQRAQVERLRARQSRPAGSRELKLNQKIAAQSLLCRDPQGRVS